MTTMPTLYVYEHCPFCIKARMIFGLKNIPFHLVTLLNDDVDTPTAMVGRKMVPILEQDGRYMPESLDIVARIDADGAPVLTGARRPEIAQWLSHTGSALYRQFLPRAAVAPFPEFATTSARAYFLTNKENPDLPFSAILKDSKTALDSLSPLLADLDALIQAPDAVNGTLSYDDIDLFAQLHSFSIVRGLAYTGKVETYRQTLSKRTGIPLLDAIAI